jgi:hypothetical protein
MVNMYMKLQNINIIIYNFKISLFGFIQCLVQYITVAFNISSTHIFPIQQAEMDSENILLE